MKRYGRKVAAIGTAAALTVAILAGGTLAWQSVSQEATNEVDGAVNPGGRLHDDFDGTNKDIYVENFTPADGSGMPIFARIRLYEYMETGEDAGVNLDDPDRVVDVAGATADTTPSIKDPSTWMVHKYDHATTPVEGEDTPIHDYVQWQMGGSTVYMPTFNMNKDSLKADINGTFAGPDGHRPGDVDDTGDKYKDYVSYSEGNTQSGTEVYDDDADDQEDDGILEVPGQTHTAKATQTATVLSMEEWKDLGSPVGNFWVYDVDGWAYWAEPILPSTATGLLLDGLNYLRNPAGDWYYAIHVEAQLATAGDWGSQQDGTGFYKDGFTDDGKQVLENAANAIVGPDGNLYIDCGNNTYKQVLDDEPYLSDLICAGSDLVIGNEGDRTDVVELGDGDDKEFGDKLLGPDDNGFYQAAGPDGLLGTADDILVTDATPENGKPFDDLKEVEATLAITPRVGKELGTDLKAKPGDELPFGVTVTLGGKTVDAAEVDWSVTGTNVADGTTISDGQLTIADNQSAGATINVTAQYGGKMDQVQLTVTNETLGYDDIHSVVPGATTKLSIDEYEWYVLVKDDVNEDDRIEAMLYETSGAIPLKPGIGYEQSTTGHSSWVGSPNQTSEFINFLNERSTLKQYCVPVQIYSRSEFLTWDQSEDKIFPLTEADWYGTQNGSATEELKDYTYTQDGVGQVLIPNNRVRLSPRTNSMHYLRNFRTSTQVSYVHWDGTLSGGVLPDQCWRPALWVTFSQTGA